MTGVAEEDALSLTIILQITDAVIADETWLGNHDVVDAGQFLPGVKIVVRFEHRCDVVLQDLHNGVTCHHSIIDSCRAGFSC